MEQRYEGEVNCYPERWKIPPRHFPSQHRNDGRSPQSDTSPSHRNPFNVIHKKVFVGRTTGRALCDANTRRNTGNHISTAGLTGRWMSYERDKKKKGFVVKSETMRVIGLVAILSCESPSHSMAWLEMINSWDVSGQTNIYYLLLLGN